MPAKNKRTRPLSRGAPLPPRASKNSNICCAEAKELPPKTEPRTYWHSQFRGPGAPLLRAEDLTWIFFNGERERHRGPHGNLVIFFSPPPPPAQTQLHSSLQISSHTHTHVQSLVSRAKIWSSSRNLAGEREWAFIELLSLYNCNQHSFLVASQLSFSALT